MLARVHGPLAPLKIADLRRDLVRALGEAPACLLDGRMGPEEWLPGSPALKRDFEEHAFDKDDLGLFDPAYDLAGALLEFGPSRAAEERVVGQYVSLTGDSAVRSRLSIALLLYGAFLMERRSWEVNGERHLVRRPIACRRLPDVDVGRGHDSVVRRCRRCARRRGPGIPRRNPGRGSCSAAGP